MSKELPYFKFFVSEWILGRIFDYPDKVQGAFIVAICHYWNKECDYNAIDFERKIGKKRFKLLSELNFFEVENDKIKIPFLDEQFQERFKNHKVSVENGLKGALKRWPKEDSHPISQNIALREDKIREDKDKSKNAQLIQWFRDLPNSMDLEDISRAFKIDVELLKTSVEEFKKHCEISYPTYAKFVFHFKNWVAKNPPKTVKRPKELL